MGWEQCGHGLSSRPRESCDLSILTPLLDFFDYPVGAATDLFNGTLKLRYSSSPFSRKFPSWPVPDLSSRSSVVGSGPVRRAFVSVGGLPSPKRWKRLVPQRTELLRNEDGVPPFLFPRTGVV